ncbi:MAG: molecular chaperone TorD family protein [Tessaracoccus sp.]|uniref:TorD/DmsD family molecular chaperone n=1 Tax=Tessaracoccus sp. TaxID=1971211 RepID=UPI001ED24467|nr:molecular chaperone TorD family protein [Tessaracoccus sp.]MBK7822752.1 molecular chaperone TorD family protein [Tessaracoccus sp.]
MQDIERLDDMAAAFSVLGRFHRAAPDEQTLLTLWELLPEWPLASDKAREGLAELAASHREGESTDAIRRDHDRLYGDTAAAVVAPYESVHRGTEGLVFDEQTLEVRAAYRELALKAPRLNREPDDHVGLEFDFVAQSCLRAIDALDAGNDAEAAGLIWIGAAFLRDHLLPWAPEMLTTMIGEAHTHFMRGVGLLSLGALASYEEFAAAG